MDIKSQEDGLKRKRQPIKIAFVAVTCYIVSAALSLTFNPLRSMYLNCGTPQGHFNYFSVSKPSDWAQ